ncbi:serine/threonine protein kinase [Micromonospora sp. KC606]|uniref:phosphotransferase n=1 Tax=Micromonospora sp. KC606 TaxID=2530379 RepID=UPI00104B0748|nr:phosphotransferase [Micromonospora sp. KC606]TDC78625.1 serine/threonine protein kinase [Micromonospora sp. KC606]
MTVPLASGREADVYALDEHRVLRRYRAGGDVRPEAEVMRHLHRLGYPVPEVWRAEGSELELTRLSGPTLAEALRAGEVDVRTGANVLADLHRRLHALPARLSGDPADRVLHLDLHPENILLTDDAPVVIDWRNSAEGPPELDTTTTALILAEVATDADAPLAALARELLTHFLAEVGTIGLLDEAVALRARTGPHGPRRLARAVALLTETGRQ